MNFHTTGYKFHEQSKPELLEFLSVVQKKQTSETNLGNSFLIKKYLPKVIIVIIVKYI